MDFWGPLFPHCQNCPNVLKNRRNQTLEGKIRPFYPYYMVEPLLFRAFHTNSYKISKYINSYKFIQTGGSSFGFWHGTKIMQVHWAIPSFNPSAAVGTSMSCLKQQNVVPMIGAPVGKSMPTSKQASKEASKSPANCLPPADRLSPPCCHKHSKTNPAQV